MDMDVIKIRYCFELDTQRREIVDLRLDPRTLEVINQQSADLPAWTRLEFHQCTHCPLHAEDHPHCPVAVNISLVIGRFDTVVSHNEIDLQVITTERIVSQRTTVQRAISSLLGLLFAASGCPHTGYLKPMARFHLPLASEEDTFYRAAGMYLLAQYFLRQEGRTGTLQLDGLKDIYSNLHKLNVMIAERIRSATQADSSVNAVILLDMISNIIPIVIEEHLEKLRPLFESYFSNSD